MGEKKSRGRSESTQVLELLAEINQLREENVKFKVSHAALNETCYYLVTELGLDPKQPHAPLQLARLALAHQGD